MAKQTDLMGLGLSPFLAQRLADAAGTIIATGVGATQASAYQIAGTQFLLTVNGSNSGKAVSLPAVGGANGCLLGDAFIISSYPDTNGAVTVFAPTGVSIVASSSVISGSLGCSILSSQAATFWPISATTWISDLV